VEGEVESRNGYPLGFCEVLETVYLDITLGNDAFLNQKSRGTLALISRKLDDFTELFVLHDCAVATEFLLESR